MRRSQVVELHFLGFESDPPSYGTLGQPCSLFGSWFPHLLERVISRLCLDIRRIREQIEAQCLFRGLAPEEITVLLYLWPQMSMLTEHLLCARHITFC